MGFFRSIGNFLDAVVDIIVGVIGGLIATAIYAVGAVIELAVDIWNWVTRGLQEFLEEGSTEVNVIKGSAIEAFVRENQAKGNYTEITYEQLETMGNSAINVTNNSSSVQRMQMVRSDRGLSQESLAQFGGKDVLKIKIAH
jgi:hypothetical protein